VSHTARECKAFQTVESADALTFSHTLLQNSVTISLTSVTRAKQIVWRV